MIIIIIGANIVNYTQVVELLKTPEGKVLGAKVEDKISKKVFEIKAKSVLFCGGPFTDELRKLEDPNFTKAVNGASGYYYYYYYYHCLLLLS